MSEESANFSRVVSLVITIGTDLLRHIVRKKIEKIQKRKSIKKRKQDVKFLRDKWKNLKNKQKHLLTVPNQEVLLKVNDVNKFDMFLLVFLLQNMFNIKEPDQGWNKVPAKNSGSIAADLVRLKEVRNHVAHAPVALLATKHFEDIWKAVKIVLTRLARPAGITRKVVTKQINLQKTRPLDTSTSEQHMWGPFIRWYRKDDQSLHTRLKETLDSCTPRKPRKQLRRSVTAATIRRSGRERKPTARYTNLDWQMNH